MQPGVIVGGKYRLLRPVGRGGMATVWAAVHEVTQRHVAIKLLSADSSPETRQRLLREAGAAGRLKSRHVVDIYDVGCTDTDEPFLVMELLEGDTLRSFLRAHKRLPPDLASAIARDIALALQEAHAAKIVHRDLKPSNIVLHRDSQGVCLKVLDFGVSKVLSEDQSLVTSAGMAVGSPAYMSPEQARGVAVDHRSDLWSLGVLMFEMLAGRRPFTADSPAAMLSLILFGSIPRPLQFVSTLDPRLEEIVMRCLHRRVSERIASAEEVVALLTPHAAPTLYVPNAEASPGTSSYAPIALAAPTSPQAPPQQEEGASASASHPAALASSSGLVSASSSQHGSSTVHPVTSSMSPGGRPSRRSPSRKSITPWLALTAAALAVALIGAVSLLLIDRRPVADSNPENSVPAAANGKAERPSPEPIRTLQATPPPASEPEPEPEPESEPQVEPKPAPKPAPVAKPQVKSTAPKPSPAKPVESRPSTPVTTTPAAPAPKPTECASPLVDENGKVVGCL